MTMTIAATPWPATEHSPNHGLIVSLFLLIASFLLTRYAHNACPDSHESCTTPNNLTLGLAVLLACLAGVGSYTSLYGRVPFPLVVVCYFGVLGVLALSGVDDLRTVLGFILGVEIADVGVFLGVKMLGSGRDGGRDRRNGDEEEAGLVGLKGREDSGDDTSRGGKDAVHEQRTRSEKEDGRVDNGNGDVHVVAGNKAVPGS
jgi:hypothetical protein